LRKRYCPHPDSGSEIINLALMSYCEARGIRLVRSRPYHKNDNPVVESRNFTLIRSYVGYRRYETDAKFRVLKELLPLISQVHNYFISKVYDIDTPYNRVLRSLDVSEEKKQELRERKIGLSYLKLLQRIHYLQKNLDQAYKEKYNPVLKDDEDD